MQHRSRFSHVHALKLFVDFM